MLGFDGRLAEQRRDLHRHPKLKFQEARTKRIVAAALPLPGGAV
jgi:metal-dependent amidase/aminoacylase/carboxypeptidase family protein